MGERGRLGLDRAMVQLRFLAPPVAALTGLAALAVVVLGGGTPGAHAAGAANCPKTRTDTVSRKRTIVFASTFPTFPINGKTFDHTRIDQKVALGSVEQWKVINASTEWHNFHIHQNPFQVVAVDGRPVKNVALRDTVSLPPHGSVTFRTKFADYTGEFVLHCHLLDHEDRGMMQTVEVVQR